jgi:hypothetical protein
LPAGTVARVLELTAQERPANGATRWTTPTMVARVGVGKDAVARMCPDHQLKPWRVDTVKVSNDLRFDEKLVDEVGLYLNPLPPTVVLSLDERIQCRALHRTQRSLPMKPGGAKSMAHDHKAPRQDDVDVFAAMNASTGEVLTHQR